MFSSPLWTAIIISQWSEPLQVIDNPDCRRIGRESEELNQQQSPCDFRHLQLIFSMIYNLMHIFK